MHVQICSQMGVVDEVEHWERGEDELSICPSAKTTATVNLFHPSCNLLSDDLKINTSCALPDAVKVTR